MNSVPPEPPRMLDQRKLLWWSFWIVFLMTPVCALFLPNALWKIPLPRFWWMNPVLACCGSIVGGAFSAGFILARLTSKTNVEFISRGLGYGMALLTVYAVLALAGCLFASKM